MRLIISSKKSYRNNLFIKTNKNIIYWETKNKKIKDQMKIISLPFLSFFNLFKRLTRNDIYQIFIFKNKYFVITIKGYILIYKSKKLIYKIDLKGSRPLNNGILKFKNKLIYGEYYSNPERQPVKIYFLDPYTGENKVLLSLKNKRHIHFVQLDKKNKDTLLIGTGDKDQESGIYKYNLNTKKLITLGSGSQKWRAVSILQKDNYIYWGSDCPYQTNYIYRYNRDSSELERLKKIEGPAYYSTFNSEGKMFIATTIEDRKKHRAIIYMSEDGENWTELKEFEKDIWPERLFGYGIIEFIKNQDQLKDLYINLHGLKE